jgi:hypothetical protein
MNFWRSCLLISCILLSGCALRTGSRPSAALASSGHFQASVCSTPRNSSPRVHQTPASQKAPGHLRHVAFLSPRLQGIYSVKSSSQNADPIASRADATQPASQEQRVDEGSAVIAQPPNTNAPKHVPNRQVVAAILLPDFQPHYAAPLVVVTIFAALVYWWLYRFAGSGQQVAQTNPLQGGNDLRVEKIDGASTPADDQKEIKMCLGEVEESVDKETDCTNGRRNLLQEIRAHLKRTRN